MGLLLEASPSDPGRGVKARRGEGRRARLGCYRRFGKGRLGQNSQRGSASRQAPTQARWDGGDSACAAEQRDPSASQVSHGSPTIRSKGGGGGHRLPSRWGGEGPASPPTAMGREGEVPLMEPPAEVGK